MPSFAYKCADASNKIVKGMRAAPSAGVLARTLEAEGLVSLSIVEQSDEKRRWWRNEDAPPSLPRADLILFISNLEMLLGAGIDLNAALGSLLKSSQKKAAGCANGCRKVKTSRMLWPRRTPGFQASL